MAVAFGHHSGPYCSRRDPDVPPGRLRTPFATPRFTVRIRTKAAKGVKLVQQGRPAALKEVRGPAKLVGGTWCRGDEGVTAWVDLPRGKSVLELA